MDTTQDTSQIRQAWLDERKEIRYIELILDQVYKQSVLYYSKSGMDSEIVMGKNGNNGETSF